MINKEITLAAMKAIGKADATAFAEKIKAGELTDTQIIDEEQKVPAFDNTKDYSTYPVGFAVQDNGQVWGLIQPYNAGNYPDQRPADLRALWGIKHTTNPAKAKPFISPYGTSGLYKAGECVLENELVYISAVDNNQYRPSEYPQNWTLYTGEVEEPTEPDSPASTAPDWNDLEAGHTFNIGDHFIYEGIEYEVLRQFALQDNWAPPALLNDYYVEVSE